jgi:hypothetical protein
VNASELAERLLEAESEAAIDSALSRIRQLRRQSDNTLDRLQHVIELRRELKRNGKTLKDCAGLIQVKHLRKQNKLTKYGSVPAHFVVGVILKDGFNLMFDKAVYYNHTTPSVSSSEESKVQSE